MRTTSRCSVLQGLRVQLLMSRIGSSWGRVFNVSHSPLRRSESPDTLGSSWGRVFNVSHAPLRRSESPDTLCSSWGRVFNLSHAPLRRSESPDTLRSLGGSANTPGVIVRPVRRGALMLTSVSGDPALGRGWGVGRGRGDAIWGLLMPRRSIPCLVMLCNFMLVSVGGGPLCVAEEPAAKPAATSAADEGSLASREQQLAQQFRDLEKTFLRLADLLSAGDPRRAALLRSVFEQAREAEVGDRLDTIVKLLEKGQLLKAGTGQTNAIDTLRELLTLLESGDTDKRLASEKEEVRQFLGRLSKLIARQRDVEGSTEAGAKETQLAERQAALAEETQGLAGDIDNFAKRMEPKEATGKESENGKQAGQKSESPAESGKESGKESGSGKESESGKESGSGKESESGDGSDQAEGDAGEASPPQEESDEAAEKSEGMDEASRARRTKKRLGAAEQRMRKAQEKLDETKRRDARQEQEKAIEELETARAELEEILRQMREEEVERLLVQLETRLRTMLRAQRAVLAGAEKLAAEKSQADRERQLEAVRLSREQAVVGFDAAKALTLVRDDGSAVAIPEALEQIRDDSAQAAARLARSDVGGTTRGVLQDLVTSLEEMLSALEKAQQEQQARQQGNQGGRPAEPGEQPLVDKLAELKMIRSLQMRVNSRTKRFSKLLAEGMEQADEPELLTALERLAERQRKIERAAHDIVTGRTE